MHYAQRYMTFLPCMQECNEFLAGNLLRSKTRYKALDETGVIGLVCRHEFPYRLYNLHHGERLVCICCMANFMTVHVSIGSLILFMLWR